MIVNNIKEANNAFYIGDSISNAIGVITYAPKDKDKIVIDHTFVKEDYRNQGIGHQLVDKVVDRARKENKKIVPQCSFAKNVLAENNNYKDVFYS